MSAADRVPGIDHGRVAVLISYSGDGGVERMVNNLVAGMIAAGHAVDVIVLKERGGHFAALPPAARVVRLGVRQAALATAPLARYLRRERPAALLAAKDRAGRAAVRARRLAGVETRVVIRIGNTLSQSLADRGRLRRALRYAPIRRLYPLADAIVAVSAGVADDVVATSGVPAERVHVVASPVITPELDRLARAAADHPWAGDGDRPLLVAMGRLTRQKDFATLLRAFARVRRRLPARLVVIGEGEDRAALEAQARELGVAGDVDLPGFRQNPYPLVAAADLFVLSSAWEGSPNALTEALYLGVPAVATDCRSGPRDVLPPERLAAVGDDAGLAERMISALEDPPAPGDLRAGVGAYTRERSTARYLEVLGLAPEPAAC